MDLVQNIVEYYDELYPILDNQKKFFLDEAESFLPPVKFLRIGCGTGMLESFLALKGYDVTGIESDKNLIDCANRRRRTQLMSIRFFQMTTIEMNRFLGKGFYNLIACLDDRIAMISDPILQRKFFFDVRELLAKNGKFIIKLTNFKYYKQNQSEQIPDLSSIRINLKTQLHFFEDNSAEANISLKTGNGKTLPVLQNELIYPITKEEIIEFGKEVGFKNFDFYQNYEKEPCSDNSKTIIAVLS